MPCRADNPHPRYTSNTPEALDYLPVHDPWVDLRRAPRFAWADSGLAPVAEEEAAPPSSTVTRASSPAPEPEPEPAAPSLLVRLAGRVHTFLGGLFGAVFSRWWASTASPLLLVASPTITPLWLLAGPVSTPPSPSPSSPPAPAGLSFILRPAPPTSSMGGSANWPSTMASSAPINIVRPGSRASTYKMGEGY